MRPTPCSTRHSRTHIYLTKNVHFTPTLRHRHINLKPTFHVIETFVSLSFMLTMLIGAVDIIIFFARHQFQGHRVQSLDAQPGSFRHLRHALQHWRHIGHFVGALLPTRDLQITEVVGEKAHGKRRFLSHSTVFRLHAQENHPEPHQQHANMCAARKGDYTLLFEM